MPTADVCARAAQIIHTTIAEGQSLDRSARDLLRDLDSRDQAEAREISWGTVRWWYRYREAIRRKLSRPISNKDRILEALLISGLYQFDHMDEPDYAITSGTVEAARVLGRPRAVGLVNGVLRSWLRDPDRLANLSTESQYATPQWLIDEIKQSWPEDWMDILDSATQKPPMTLRVNPKKTSRARYLDLLSRDAVSATPSDLSPWGVTLLKGRDVSRIPGFEAGMCSVQDEAAQLTPFLCNDFNGGRVLDACAAPGGKTTHLLETLPGIASFTAIDLPGRTSLIRSNLNRLGEKAEVISTDIHDVDRWWDRKPFDLILLDAPCSGTGVLKRHPDIRHHRRPSDIGAFSAKQERLLHSLWPLLARGGHFLYATCSILTTENDNIVRQALDKFSDARIKPFELPSARFTSYGQQILPNAQRDGLYYASLQKA